MDPETLLEFWFAEQPKGLSNQATRSRWFASGTDFDTECYNLFEPWVHAALKGELADWRNTTPHALALIILCDQIPRNIYRDSAAAFDADQTALETARAIVETNAHKELNWDQRAFAYLPFEHSENLLDQHTSVGLFTQLRDEAKRSGDHQALQYTGNYLQYAHAHRQVIEEFGRFPHRNKILARTSTEAEERYLEQGGGFS